MQLRILFAASVVLLAACDSSTPTRSRAIIAAEPASLDFGARTGGTQTSKTVKISNEGTATLNISSVGITQDTRSAFAVSSAPLTLSPGDGVELTVTYSAPAAAGADGASLLIASDAENTIELIISLAAQSLVACTPKTCTGEGANCGQLNDGCGGTLSCGTCTAPQTCAGGGTANVCGCTGETTTAFCARQGANCGNVTAPDNCGITRTNDCGVCNAPESCGGAGTANVCGCAPETNSSFCARLGRNCDSVTAADNCGTSRTAGCGVCTGTQSCGGSGVPNVCGCAAETNAAFCTRNGKNCGAVTATDNCGVARTVGSCGSCVSPETCGGTNVCACVPETNATFCSRLGSNCGPLSATDNCGTTRTVASCGSCASPQTCGGGTVPNVCGCSAESNTTFCSRQGKDCGSLTSADNCGATRTASCGSCASTQTCTGNVCVCAPETDAVFCSRLGKNCGAVSGTDNCGAARSVVSCGTCTSPQSCDATNVCSCTAETDGAFCSRLGKNCGQVSANDNCGTARTVTSCGTCSSTQMCNAANVCVCNPETDVAFCARYSKTCGPHTAADNCGATRTASCGNDCWREATPMTVARSFPGMAALGGQIYVVGGGVSSGSTNAFERYDPATDSWASLPASPLSRSLTTFTAMGGKLWNLGGCLGSDCNVGISPVLQAYTPSLGMWNTHQSMTTARHSFASASVGGLLYAIGGRGACPPCTGMSSVEAYNETTNTWIARAALPATRHSMTAVAFNGKIYVVGGVTGTNTETNQIDVYDPATDSWSISPSPVPTIRQGAGVAAISTGIFVIGGFGGGLDRVENEFWHQATNAWFTRASLPFARYQVVAAEAAGAIYVTGSAPTNQPSNRLHIYFPPP